MSSSPIPSFASVSNSCDISCTLPKVETWEDLLVMLVKDILGTMDWGFRFVWHLAVLAHWSTCYEKTLSWWFTLLALANDQTALHALHVQFHQSLRDWLYCVQKRNLQEINQIYRLSKATVNYNCLHTCSWLYCENTNFDVCYTNLSALDAYFHNLRTISSQYNLCLVGWKDIWNPCSIYLKYLSC